MKRSHWAALASISVVALGCSQRTDDHDRVEDIGHAASADSRGVDPGTIAAPLYAVSIDYVTTTQPATPNVEIYDAPLGGVSQSESADKLRLGLDAQIQKSDGTLTFPLPRALDCQIGSTLDGGLLGEITYTTPGSTYTSCLYSPAEPARNGAALALDAPIPVGPDDTLNLYTELAVLDPDDPFLQGDIVSTPATSDSSLRDMLTTTGITLQAVGSVVAAAGEVGAAVGAVISVVGGVFSFLGYVWQPTITPGISCNVTPSLVPGFGTGQPPSDAASPMLRTQLGGRQLYELTANGDAVIPYDLNYGSVASTGLCNRPDTKIQLRIKRVPMEGPPDTAEPYRASSVSAPFPDQIDAFAINGLRGFVHDGYGYDPGAPLAWEAQNDLSDYRTSQACLPQFGDVSPASPGSSERAELTVLPFPNPCKIAIFPANAFIASLTPRPGQINLYAVDTAGNLEWNTRSYDANTGYWQAWNAVSSGALFPPGATVAAVSSDAAVDDIFVVGTDGGVWHILRINTTFATLGEVMPAGTTAPGGGVAAVLVQPGDLEVFVVGASGQILESSGAPLPLWAAWSAPSALPPAGIAPFGAKLAAVSRESDRIDVAVVDWTGVVQMLPIQSGTPLPLQAATPVSMAAPPGAPIALVSRKVGVSNSPGVDNELINNEEMDAFVIGESGHFVHAHWRYGDNSYSWSPAGAEQLFATAAPGAVIGAAAPYAGAIFVSALGTDGLLQKTWFVDEEDGVNNWQSVSP